MTAIATFRFATGLILCADTQETIPDYSKSNTEKITVYHDSRLTAAWAGAGDAELIETFGYRMKRLLAQNAKSKWDSGLVMEAFHAVLTETHNKYVYPIPKEDRPFMQLLGVFQLGKESPIGIKTQNITVRPCKNFETIGSGILVGQYLAESFWEHTHHGDAQIAAALAVYIMQEIKDYSDGCGKNTEAVIFQTGIESSFLQPSEVRIMEEQTARLRPLVAEVARIVMSPKLSDQTIDGDLQALDEHIRAAIAEIRDDERKNSSEYWLKRLSDIERYKPKRQSVRAPYRNCVPLDGWTLIGTVDAAGSLVMVHPIPLAEAVRDETLVLPLHEAGPGVRK